MLRDLPPLPKGFRPVSGKRRPPDNDTRYFVQLRTGFADMNISYTAPQLVWVWGYHSGDIVAVKEAG